MISRAFTVLNDPKQRQTFDEFGADEPRVAAAANGAFSRLFRICWTIWRRTYARADLSDDVWRCIWRRRTFVPDLWKRSRFRTHRFSNGPPPRFRTRQNDEAVETSNISLPAQFLPLLVLLFFSLTNLLFSPSNEPRMQSNRGYQNMYAQYHQQQQQPPPNRRPT